MVPLVCLIIRLLCKLFSIVSGIVPNQQAPNDKWNILPEGIQILTVLIFIMNTMKVGNYLLRALYWLQ